MAYSQPTVFLSHGGGPSLFMDAKDIPMMKGLDKHSAAADFLQNFTQTTGLRKPRAILVLSAHWDEQVCTVNTKRYHSLYRDYGNFGPSGNVTWPAPGAPEVAGMAKRLLQQRGIQCVENDRRGLDHGVFVPLKLVFPKADIPGFDVYDDCGIPKKALAHALDVLDSPILGTKQCADNTSVPCTIGVIGAAQSTTTESLLFALNGSGVPVIGPHATLPNLSRYDKYYRTIPTDDQQIQATVSLLKELSLEYVAVVHTNDDFGRYGARKLKEISISNGICVDSIQEISIGEDIQTEKLITQRENTKDKSLRVVFFGSREVFKNMNNELGFSSEIVKGISWIVVEYPENESGSQTGTGTDNIYPNGTFVITPSINTVSDIETYIVDKWDRSKTSPNDDLENLMKCSGLTNVPKLTFKDTASVIDAVFSFANSLQSQRKYYSKQDNFRNNFKFIETDAQKRYDDSILENVTVGEFAYLKRVSGFVENGEFQPDSNTALYAIKYTTENVEIGNFRNNSIYFGNTTIEFDTVPSSKCNEHCEICYEHPDIPFAFLDGDTFILGIFSVHETDPDDPFRCSTVRILTLDILLIETFLYSVLQSRNETGIQFGAIAIDDCYSAAQTALVLSQVLSRKVNLTNPYTGNVIDVGRIAAVVTMSGSAVTIQTSLLLSEIKIPVIAGAASSPDLDDRLNFPYFLRTVPSDVEQARAMVSIIKHMGWKYVSVLYVNNNYGVKGTTKFLELAKERGICVAKEAEGISDVKQDDDELNTVFNNLRNQYSDVVVYFGTESKIRDFLQVVNGKNRFIFLGSEDWADRQHVLDAGKNGTLGSITLMNDVVVLANNPLRDHLKGLRPETVDKERNPWFVEFWEESFKCDLPQSFRNTYNKQCDANVKFTDEQITTFVEDHRITHTSVAVKALTHGLANSKTSLCKQDPQFPCNLYFKYIDEVVTHIRTVTISRGGSNVRVFNDDGNGNIGFRINNIQFGSNQGLEYKKVGLYDDNTLTLQQNNLNFYLELRNKPFDGSCHKTSCEVCSNESIITRPAVETTTHTHPVREEFGIPDYTIIGILGFLFIVAIVMGIIIVCCLKKRIIELENRLKDIKYEIRTGTVYPPLQIANPGPSGDSSMYEWRKAQTFLNGGNRNFSNGGIVNKAFDGLEMYIHAKHDDSDSQQEISAGNISVSPRENSSPRRQDSTEQTRSFPDSPVYRPPSSSYGISTHHSFKKPSDLSHTHNGQIKKQPRTQLAVPPCRPELPPRDPEQQRMNGQRQNDYINKYDHLASAIPKEKVRKSRSSPKRNFSPPSLNHSPPSTDYMRYRDTDAVDSSKYNGAPAMSFSDNHVPLADMTQIGGSMEKISRV